MVKLQDQDETETYHNSQDRDETETLNPHDQDETEMFPFPKLSKPRRDETFNLQDQDETETFQKTSRDHMSQFVNTSEVCHLTTCFLRVRSIIFFLIYPQATLSSWLSTVRGELGRLPVHGPGFKFQGWPGNLGQDDVCVCFEINFSDRKEGSTVSSIICDHWWIKH